MSYGMYISAEGAKAQSQRLEVIANNMANVDTVGFKPDGLAFRARYAEAIQLGDAAPDTRDLPNIGGGVKAIETRTSFAPGQLERTGDNNDVAILGDGFFAVATPDSDEPLLTRAGSLAVAPDGQLLIAGANLPVLAADGAPIELLPDEPWKITADGYVEQAGEQIPLALVQPQSLDDLTKVGANLFRAREEVFPVPEPQREVRQGYLEMSGANSTDLMMEMIETNRAFEANTQLIRHQDTATGTLINRLLG